MANFLGILELIAWIVSVIALAAGITYAVTRLAPSRNKRGAEPTSAGDTT